MDREELKKYIDDLDDDAEIIVIKSREQIDVLPHRCERIDVPGKILWVLKRLIGGTWKVAIVWIVLMDLFPGDIPKPKAVILQTADLISYVLHHVDYAFPNAAHDSQSPLIAYRQNGNVHYLPPSGFSPHAVAATTGVQITSVIHRA